VQDTTGSSEKTLRESGERVNCNMHFFTYKVVLHDRIAADIEVRLNDEFIEYRWVRPDELRDLNLSPPARELYRELGYL
jgi:8-oxo-dGTP pyrophosphatase MutT (NUDIX family)